MKKEIKEIIDSNFRGNVYIVQDNEVICENVTGFADLTNEIPNTLDTKFASASAGKVFVAVGILQYNPNGKDYVYFQGCDPGVSFISEYNPNNNIISVLVSNYGDNVWKEMRKVRENLYKC